MLTWVVLCAGAGSLALAARWRTRRVDFLGRVRDFPIVSVLLLVVVALTAAVPVVRAWRLEGRLSGAASELVGSAVAVDCQDRGQELLDVGAELGRVAYDAAGVPEPRTLIKRAPCDRLADYLGSDRSRPTRDEVIAVHVLSHEAQHLAGLADEARAECAAMQSDALTARLLGATAEQAARLARTYWLVVYPQMSGDYRSPECRAGGSLDERLADPPWGP